MSHIGNDAITDAQRDVCTVCEGLDVEVCIACGIYEPHIPELMMMHGKCNRCDKKIFIRSTNDGHRNTRNLTDYWRTQFYGLFVGDDWKFILSRCCNRKVRRARTFGGHWTADTTMSLSAGNTYTH